jgi:hypothetical protein
MGLTWPAWRCKEACPTTAAPVWHDAAMASDLRALDRAQALRDRVIRMIRDHDAELSALGIAKLWLFGSLARGDAPRLAGARLR